MAWRLVGKPSSLDSTESSVNLSVQLSKVNSLLVKTPIYVLLLKDQYFSSVHDVYCFFLQLIEIDPPVSSNMAGKSPRFWDVSMFQPPLIFRDFPGFPSQPRLASHGGWRKKRRPCHLQQSGPRDLRGICSQMCCCVKIMRVLKIGYIPNHSHLYNRDNDH